MANYKINVCGEVREYPEGTQLLEIAEEYKKDYEHDIVLAMMNNKLCELNKTIKEDSVIDYLSMAVIPDDYLKTTVNLKSPLVVNSDNNKAAQVIAQENYPIKFPALKKEEA